MIFPRREDATNKELILTIIKIQGYLARYGQTHTNWHETLNEVIARLEPQESGDKAHWIMPVQDDGMSDPIYYQVRCSKCGFDLDPQTWHQELHQYGADKYCPKCGRQMY